MVTNTVEFWTTVLDDADWDTDAVHVFDLIHDNHPGEVRILKPGVETLKELQIFLRAFYEYLEWGEWENDDLEFASSKGDRILVTTSNLKEAMESGKLFARSRITLSKESYEAHIKNKVADFKDHKKSDTNSKYEDYSAALSKIKETDIDNTIAKYRIAIYDLGALYNVTVLQEPSSLEDFHEYLRAYYDYIGWRPWLKLDLFFIDEDEDEDEGYKCKVKSENLSKALTFGKLFVNRDLIREALRDAKTKYG
eukprot:Phypoly_transcript_13330.p1 GENE.Phypoly_transcript_13330~~Phypoly_transcript_13330.p1  ORF type:complete len:252 (+),score=31.98 Phypoly_transcript_13330:259-1014(+)